MADRPGYEPDLDPIEDTCWECGGEGYVADCMTEYACIDPEYGCDQCLRRCPVCNVRTPTTPSTAPGAA